MQIKHSYPTIGNEELEVIKKVLKFRELAQGKFTEEFEEKIAKFIGTKYAVATNSGTSALHLALLILGIGFKDEVIIPSFVCSALLNAVNYVKAIPVLADINDYDFNISFEDVKRKITKKTKAIIIPHLFGLPADLDKFLSLDIPIIEDCAQSIGAKYRGKLVGSFGKVSILSFYATKMLTTGEGGMLLTNNRKLAKIAKDLRSYDNKNNYRLRFNYKLSDLNAGIGLVQFKKLPEFIRRRRKIAKFYTNELKDIKNISLPVESEDKFNVYFRYCLKVKNNSLRYIKSIQKKGIEVKKPIYKPLHRYLGIIDNKFPNTSYGFRRVISLPIYPELTDKKLKKIIRVVKKVLIEE